MRERLWHAAGVQPDGAELRERWRGEGPRALRAWPDPASETLAPGVEAGQFGPRQRPWKQRASGSAEAVWTPVYLDFRSRLPVITLAQSLTVRRDQVPGVAGVD